METEGSELPVPAPLPGRQRASTLLCSTTARNPQFSCPFSVSPLYLFLCWDIPVRRFYKVPPSPSSYFFLKEGATICFAALAEIRDFNGTRWWKVAAFLQCWLLPCARTALCEVGGCQRALRPWSASWASSSRYGGRGGEKAKSTARRRITTRAMRMSIITPLNIFEVSVLRNLSFL